MTSGQCLGRHPTLDTIRQRFARYFRQLPDPHKKLQDPSAYTVKITPQLEQRLHRAAQSL